MSKQLNSTQRAQIITLLETGLSTRKVAKKFEVSQITIVVTMKKYKERAILSHAGGNGRFRVLNQADIIKIKQNINDNPKSSLRKIQNKLEKDAKKKSFSSDNIKYAQ